MQNSSLLGLLLLCPLFTLFAQTETAPTAASQSSWLQGGAQNHFQESPPLTFPETREADIMWEKRIWRVVDTREKINLPFRNENLPLYEIIEQGIEKGALTAYSAQDDRFGSPLNREEALSMYNTVDSLWVMNFDNDNDYEEKLTVVINELNPDNIKRWRIQEISYFDARYGVMKTRIIGIAPLLESRSEDGNTVRFESPMFWINYAEARSWLSQFPVPTQGNDKGLMSWEDHFEMRHFHGYVYKEQDMLGRRLVDYNSGRDLLLKSQQIDRSIQNYEHDVWEY